MNDNIEAQQRRQHEAARAALYATVHSSKGRESDVVVEDVDRVLKQLRIDEGSSYWRDEHPDIIQAAGTYLRSLRSHLEACGLVTRDRIATAEQIAQEKPDIIHLSHDGIDSFCGEPVTVIEEAGDTRPVCQQCHRGLMKWLRVEKPEPDPEKSEVGNLGHQIKWDHDPHLEVPVLLPKEELPSWSIVQKDPDLGVVAIALAGMEFGADVFEMPYDPETEGERQKWLRTASVAFSLIAGIIHQETPKNGRKSITWRNTRD